MHYPISLYEALSGECRYVCAGRSDRGNACGTNCITRNKFKTSPRSTTSELEGCWRNIAISLIDPRSIGDNAVFVSGVSGAYLHVSTSYRIGETVFLIVGLAAFFMPGFFS